MKGGRLVGGWSPSVLPLKQLRQAGSVLIAEGSQGRSQHFEQLLRFAGASIGASRGGLIRKSFACVTWILGVPALGAGSRWFESNHPDQFTPLVSS